MLEHLHVALPSWKPSVWRTFLQMSLSNRMRDGKLTFLLQCTIPAPKSSPSTQSHEFKFGFFFFFFLAKSGKL